MTISLPRREPSPAVLFLDDEPEVTRGFERAFRRERFRVLTANNVVDAEATLAREDVHVVVSDERMPDMRGSHFLASLRATRPEITRILLTGHGDLETVTAALNQAEIFRFLTKPCRPEDLRASLDEALEARRRYLAWSDHAERDAGLRRLEATFDAALDELWLAAQPIVTPAGAIVAYECLVRTSGDLGGPAGLFGAATDLGRTVELERIIRAAVAEIAPRVAEGVDVFCNIETETLLDEALFDPEAPLSRVAHRVVIEVTERSSLTDVPALEDRVARLRALGFRLALDDFGAGTAGFSALANLRPDVVKFDMALVRGVASDLRRERTMATMLGLCQSLGATTLAEGVETARERDKLVELGFDLLQGYHFGRPERLDPRSG